MRIALRSAAAAVVLALLTLLAPTPASAAPRTTTVPFSYETTVLGEPLTVDATFTLTSVNTTTTSATVTGILSGTATWGDLTATVDDTVTATFTPVCGETVATLTVDVGSFDVVFAGIAYTVDPGSFTVTVSRDSRLGGAICAAADLLADGAGDHAVQLLLKKSLAVV
ncbi:MAG TPA: hypothetical protein VK306_13115 [Acidimicrobiales bacterium]|nr:hypothetical protein [Acidimicrobiales bacterium]